MRRLSDRRLAACRFSSHGMYQLYNCQLPTVNCTGEGGGIPLQFQGQCEQSAGGCGNEGRLTRTTAAPCACMRLPCNVGNMLWLIGS